VPWETNSDSAAEDTAMSGDEAPHSSDVRFARIDETPDEMFYGMPRLVTHIDDHACIALAAYYDRILKDGDRILDLMSSCVSHLPETLKPAHVTGHGMNTTELAANPQLDTHFVQNLNRTPALPFDENAFDACLVAVSVQYLVDPVAVFREIARVLKTGGVFAVSFSNRMFPTKAVAAWREGDDAAHCNLVESYLHEAGSFRAIATADISPQPGRSDPLFVVSGEIA
jgi:SAM-dependent methyltransferase